MSLAQHPDRLVAFLYLLDQDPTRTVQELTDAATEINLAEVPSLPERSADGQDQLPPDYEEIARLYDCAYALTGQTAKMRGTISSLSEDHAEDLAERVRGALAEHAPAKVEEVEKGELAERAAAEGQG